LRIALVVPGGVDRSGRERVIPALLWLIERLARRHTLHVFALRQYPEPCTYPLLGATVHNLGAPGTGFGKWPGLQIWQQWRSLVAGLRAAGPFDLLHGFWVGTPGFLAALAGRWLKLPVVASIGGGELVWLPGIRYGGGKAWRSRIKAASTLRLVSALTAGSHHALAPVGERHPPVQWVPLGVDTDLYHGPVPRPAGPPWRFLHVATINRVKDPATLLRALHIVAGQQPDIHLDWIGTDILNGAMQRLAASLGLAERVTFHGALPFDELVPFYRQAHLYLQSSLHEAQGVAVCEAAAAGLPTVGTAVGLVTELAPQAAIAVPPGDPAALAEGILALLAEPQRRERLGHAAQAWARAHDADWTAAQFEAIYDRLARGSWAGEP
jgi:glycosyltransferase involved in cell wall biosynthesis